MEGSWAHIPLSTVHFHANVYGAVRVRDLGFILMNSRQVDMVWWFHDLLFNSCGLSSSKKRPFYSSSLRAGGVLLLRARRAAAKLAEPIISVTASRIFSIRSSVELSRPVVVHLPICSVWTCPWAKNVSNLPPIGSRLCGNHISETAGWMYPI